MRGAHALLAVGLVLAASVQAQEFVSARVRGKVVDRAGVPVVGAKVWVNRTTAARGVRMASELREAITDADGRYAITVRFEKGKRIMVPEVFAEAKGYARAAAPREFPLEEGNVETVHFTLAKGEVITGIATATWRAANTGPIYVVSERTDRRRRLTDGDWGRCPQTPRSLTLGGDASAYWRFPGLHRGGFRLVLEECLKRVICLI